MLPHVRYLHGFGSGPRSEKGLELGRRLADCTASFAIPDLDGGDFTTLTMEAMRNRVQEACPSDGPIVLIGSSMGGYLAAWLACGRILPNLAGIVLIAPAFGFTTRWADIIGPDGVEAWKRSGSREFFHYGQQRNLPLGAQFIASCEALPELPGDPVVPCAIVHGRGDQTVDHAASMRYAAAHPAVELHLVQGDHRLTEPRHVELIAWTARDLINRVVA